MPDRNSRTDRLQSLSRVRTLCRACPKIASFLRRGLNFQIFEILKSICFVPKNHLNFASSQNAPKSQKSDIKPLLARNFIPFWTLFGTIWVWLPTCARPENWQLQNLGTTSLVCAPRAMDKTDRPLTAMALWTLSRASPRALFPASTSPNHMNFDNFCMLLDDVKFVGDLGHMIPVRQPKQLENHFFTGESKREPPPPPRPGTRAPANRAANWAANRRIVRRIGRRIGELGDELAT